MRPSSASPRNAGNQLNNFGFTLIELLVVISILATIAAFIIPAATKIAPASQLTQAGQMITDQLSLARQTALSENRAVEVRFYQFGDPSTPGEQVSNPSLGKYRALQLFEIMDSGSAVAMEMIQRVPPTVIMDSGATLSSIFDPTQAKSLPTTIAPTAVAGPLLNNPLPVVGTQYNATSFRFLPNGSTNLSPATSSWFVSAHSLNNGDAVATPPPNFFTIQIDATNGHIRTFRP